ncbi:hypothetical protein EDB84DRAFT_1215100 [Lactarius hengduanensis]|nr:hypothetical protein EDB84DRAFT_1215100 [Lactarius hengduanensis]
MSTPPIPPHIEEFTAPLLLGVLWNWTLYGVLVVQLCGEDVYSYNFPGDRTLLKLLVYSVFLVETVQTALTGADLCYWFVSGFGNMDHLSSPYLSAIDVPIIGSIVSLAVQLFSCIVSGYSAGGRPGLYACSSASALLLPQWPRFLQVSIRMSSISSQIWLSGNSSSDLLIAGSMLFHLGRRRREGDDYFSDHAISRVVRLTVETNVLTATVGIVSLFTIAIFTDKPWFTCPIAILGKLYSNTLLVSLNNRISIREGSRSVVRSQALTFALTTNSQPTLEIVHVVSEKPSVASLAGSSEDSTGRDTSRVFDIA